MQPKSVPSFSVNSSDWAGWLDSITQQSELSQASLVELEGEVQFLNEQEQEDLRKEGQSFQKLTMDKIIDITQKVWKDPTIKRTEKDQMLQGLRHMHQQRQVKFERLFWLVRIFAKFQGVEADLRAEEQTLDQMEASLTQAKPAASKKGVGLPKLHKPVVKLEVSVQKQLSALEADLGELVDLKSTIEDDSRDEWNEICFMLEKKLYHMKQKLTTTLLTKYKSRIDKIEETVAKENPAMPRVKDIAELFGYATIKDTLRETLAAACASQRVSDAEVKRDQALFDCSETEAHLRYVQRAIKAQNTKLSLSLVTAIERTWREVMDTDQPAATRVLEGKRVIFIPKDQEIYLKEEYISCGSYKATFVTTPYHLLETENDRGKLVMLQSVQGVKPEEIPAGEKNEPSGQAEKISSIDTKSSGSKPSKSNAKQPEDHEASLEKTEPHNWQSMIVLNQGAKDKKEGTPPEKKGSKAGKEGQGDSTSSPDGKGGGQIKGSIVKPKATPGSKASLPKISGSVKLPKPATLVKDPRAQVEDKPKQAEDKPKEDKPKYVPSKEDSMGKLAKMIEKFAHPPSYKPVKVDPRGIKAAQVQEQDKEIDSLDTTDIEDDTSYVREARNYLRYNHLPGIWPTIKVTVVDKRIAIIQNRATYPVKTKAGVDMQAITLDDMCRFIRADQLFPEDQLVLIDMLRSSLTGVESLHQLDVLHRDLKPQNILCSSDGKAGVTDFGTLCESTIEHPPGSGIRIQNIAKKDPQGTPHYFPPEGIAYSNFAGLAKITTAVDIWAVGLILWEAFSGESVEQHPAHLSLGDLTRVSPFAMVRLISQILTNQKNRGDIYAKLYPKPAEESSLAHLVWSCTRPDPAQRPSIQEIIVRFDAWADYAKDRLTSGQVNSIIETFQDAVV